MFINAPILELFRSFLDILIVTTMIYFSLKLLINSNKHMLIINFIFGFVLLYGMAKLLNLTVTVAILSNFYSWGIIIIVILFQVEIRNSIEKMNDFSNFFKSKNIKHYEFLDELTDTVYSLSKLKIGALITFPKNQSFSNYTKNAVEIDAKFSKLLLMTIFNKETALHDGAVIIEDNRITHSCTYFPIALNMDLSKKYGTRHRAALTISKETDAVTIVVSEETGMVSVTYRGKLYSNISEEFFKELLNEKLESGDING